MNLNDIRRDFPLLSPKETSRAVIYLDSACQSLRPQPVVDAITKYYTEYPACSGRSNHHLAATVSRLVDESRQQLAKMIGAAHEREIIYTRNATEGINLVAFSLGLQAGDVVLIGGKEHNSNLIPWQTLVKRGGIKLEVLPTLADGRFDLPAFEKALSRGVKLVSLGYTSNLDGVSIPAEQIIKIAHKAGALVLLDAAQAIPHRKINVHSLDVDFLAFSGHKMLGPSGTGVLYGKSKLLEKMSPFLVGGDTVANSTYENAEFLPIPEKFEAGLQDYAGIIGLGEAARYLQKVGFDAVQKQELLLNQIITEGCQDIHGLHIIGPSDPAMRSGIFTFYFEDIDSHRVALMLDQMAGICVRSGQHCVHSWFNQQQIKGSVRASVYFYNTRQEAERFVENLKKIRKVL